MTWPKYVLLAFFALSALSTVTQIGKPRKPLDPSAAAATLILSGLLATLVVIA